MIIDLKDQIRTYWHEKADKFDDIACHPREVDGWERVSTLAGPVDRSPYAGVTNDFFLHTASLDAANGADHGGS